MSHIETGSFVSELTEAPPALRVVSWNIARGSQLDAIIEFLAQLQMPTSSFFKKPICMPGEQTTALSQGKSPRD